MRKGHVRHVVRRKEIWGGKKEKEEEVRVETRALFALRHRRSGLLVVKRISICSSLTANRVLMPVLGVSRNGSTFEPGQGGIDTLEFGNKPRYV